jgi:hypothetical protein
MLFIAPPPYEGVQKLYPNYTPNVVVNFLLKMNVLFVTIKNAQKLDSHGQRE